MKQTSVISSLRTYFFLLVIKKFLQQDPKPLNKKQKSLNLCKQEFSSPTAEAVPFNLNKRKAITLHAHEGIGYSCTTLVVGRGAYFQIWCFLLWK